MENVQLLLHCLFLTNAFIVQSQTCKRVPDEHPPGIDCLPDEVVRHILVRVDSDTLLNIGTNISNDRLYLLDKIYNCSINNLY